MQIKPEVSSHRTEMGRARAKRLTWPARAITIVCAWMAQIVEFSERGLVVTDNVAYAKGGGGGGNGGGNGGGHGGGNGNGGGHGGGHGGGAAAGHGGGHGVAGTGGSGKGHGKGIGHGHARSGQGYGHGHGKASKHGVSASTLGSLNAAHASPTARANAAPNSTVGAIAAFVNAVESNEISNRQRIEAAAQALASKANKPITTPVLSQVAYLANVEVSRREARAIAHRAAQIQDGGS